MPGLPPHVSIILPTHNRPSTLTQSIQSVLDQTCKDFELIIVDDGSTDNTKSIVESISDDRMRYVHSSKNKEAGAARNIDIRASYGEILAFQDSDDMRKGHKLEIQVESLSVLNHSWGMVYSDMLWLRETGEEAY